MMREVKFRAWDKVNNHMVTHEEFLKCPEDFANIVLGAANVSSQFEVRQYTGLKDKNGVEIYEGDILATENDGSDGADVWAREIIGDVYWNDGFQCWNHRTKAEDDESIYSRRYVTVIGNIYENKELLNAN